MKEQGDWIVFPRTLELVARGRFGMDDAGVLHFDGVPAPRGIVINETFG
ncbi:MAG: hypothetical protein M5R36_03845 [Deltaproteobacteria bacterium]|nr:hypothetical protein [Deltaproteobacteria bacterium]